MNTRKSSEPATAVLDHPGPSPTPQPQTKAPRSHHAGAGTKHVAGEGVDLAAEMDYWHVNYMTRPYYKEGRSFADYEDAYRYGSEEARKAGKTTFEDAEKDHLAGGWAAARVSTSLPWEEVRDAARDAWTRARRDRQA